MEKCCHGESGPACKEAPAALVRRCCKDAISHKPHAEDAPALVKVIESNVVRTMMGCFRDILDLIAEGKFNIHRLLPKNCCKIPFIDTVAKCEGSPTTKKPSYFELDDL